MSNNTAAFMQLALDIVATSPVSGTNTLMYARLVSVFVINVEKHKVLCYKQKIADMFENTTKYCKILMFCWSHQHTHSVCECTTNKAYINH